MIKFSSMDKTQQSDESGRNILISTGPRIYFREKFSTTENNLADFRNDELNNFIAADVSKSENIKTFVPNSGSIESKSRELGIIKKSKQLGIYYLCIASKSELRVISVKDSIKEGKPPAEFGSRVETGVTDPKRGRQIRVNTTVRKIYKQDFKTMAFPPNPLKTFENAGILELSKYIAEEYAKNAANVKNVWKNEAKSPNIMEIRSFGTNKYFVTILTEEFCDIISIQGQWLSQKQKKQREGYSTEFTPSREGKGERKNKKGYLR